MKGKTDTQLLTQLESVGFKSIIAAFALFLLARLMGKKQISQLTFFDYVVGISIGSIAAAMSVDPHIPVLNGVFSMIVWALFPILFSYISLHSMSVRRLLDGTPIVLIQNGKIIEKNLRRTKYTVNDLLEELRIKDVFNIAEVRYAVLETSGKLSALTEPSKQSAQVFANVIIDGHVMVDNLRQLKLNEQWLTNELTKLNIFSIKDVLLAVCDSNRILHIDKKNSDPDDLTIFQ